MQPPQQSRVEAVAGQNADRPARQCRRRFGQHAEGGRRVQIDRLHRGLDLFGLAFHAQCCGDLCGKRAVHIVNVAKHAATYRDGFNFSKFERKCADNVILFRLGHGAIKLTCLAVVVHKAGRTLPQLVPRLACRVGDEACIWIFPR